MSLYEKFPSGPFVFETARTQVNWFLRSKEPDAVILPVNLASNFGYLKGGTVLTQNASAAGRKGLYMPYPCTGFIDTNGALIADKVVGRTFVLADVAETATKLLIPKDHNLRYVVGDSLIITNGTTTEDLGAIVGKAEKPAWIEITFTTAAGTTFLTSANTSVYVKNNGALCLLQRDRNTGLLDLKQDSLPAGGIIKDAVVYKEKLPNIDATAITDLGMKEKDNFLIF